MYDYKHIYLAQFTLILLLKALRLKMLKSVSGEHIFKPSPSNSREWALGDYMFLISDSIGCSFRCNYFYDTTIKAVSSLLDPDFQKIVVLNKCPAM